MLLVTGITGHTGRYFLQELIEHKYDGEIRCIVRDTSDTLLLDNSGLTIEKVVGDLNDQQFIEQVMPGIKTVMHIYNIHHSPRIVQSAIENSVERVILVHTTGIYSEFKYASEEYKNIEQRVLELKKACNCPMKITIVRPSMIYGDLSDRNMSKFIQMVDKLRVIPVINNGNSMIQPVHARDLGKAFFAVLMSPVLTADKAYNLSGEKPIKMIDVFKLISNEMNKKVIFVNVPIGLGVLLAKIIKNVTIGRIDYIEKVQRMGENRSYSHDDAMNDFGFHPMPFEKGISLEVQEYMKNKSK